MTPRLKLIFLPLKAWMLFFCLPLLWPFWLLFMWAKTPTLLSALRRFSFFFLLHCEWLPAGNVLCFAADHNTDNPPPPGNVAWLCNTAVNLFMATGWPKMNIYLFSCPRFKSQDMKCTFMGVDFFLMGYQSCCKLSFFYSALSLAAWWCRSWCHWPFITWQSLVHLASGAGLTVRSLLTGNIILCTETSFSAVWSGDVWYFGQTDDCVPCVNLYKATSYSPLYKTLIQLSAAHRESI